MGQLRAGKRGLTKKDICMGQLKTEIEFLLKKIIAWAKTEKRSNQKGYLHGQTQDRRGLTKKNICIGQLKTDKKGLIKKIFA